MEGEGGKEGGREERKEGEMLGDSEENGREGGKVWPSQRAPGAWLHGIHWPAPRPRSSEHSCLSNNNQLAY